MVVLNTVVVTIIVVVVVVAVAAVAVGVLVVFTTVVIEFVALVSVSELLSSVALESAIFLREAWQRPLLIRLSLRFYTMYIPTIVDSIV